MYPGLKIKPPFFEVGPKAIIYGEAMLKLAKVIDATAMKYDVDVIVTPQYTDIPLLAQNTERILVFAQHMDPLCPGRGLGSVLPEAVKAAGAVGVMLDDVPAFAENVMCQHYIISYGDNTGLIEDLCAILGIEIIR